MYLGKVYSCLSPSNSFPDPSCYISLPAVAVLQLGYDWCCPYTLKYEVLHCCMGNLPLTTAATLISAAIRSSTRGGASGAPPTMGGASGAPPTRGWGIRIPFCF